MTETQATWNAVFDMSISTSDMILGTFNQGRSY